MSGASTELRSGQPRKAPIEYGSPRTRAPCHKARLQAEATVDATCAVPRLLRHCLRREGDCSGCQREAVLHLFGVRHRAQIDCAYRQGENLRLPIRKQTSSLLVTNVSVALRCRSSQISLVENVSSSLTTNTQTKRDIPPTLIEGCAELSTPSSVPSRTTVPPLQHRNQHGRFLCSVADASWGVQLSIPRRATARTSWRPDLTYSGRKNAQPFGPWFVQRVTLLLSSVQHAETQQIKSSRASATWPRWLDQVSEVALWPLPGTHHQYQSLSRLFKRAKVITPRTRILPFLLKHHCRIVFLSEVADLVPTTLRKMPRLSELGPLGMRAAHWYDFGDHAGDSILLVQAVAHIAAAAVPHSVLPKVTHGGQKKESVAKCAGPLQYGVGLPDGANTMIKTIQYLAESASSGLLVALDIKAAFQNVSRRAMLHSIE